MVKYSTQVACGVMINNKNEVFMGLRREKNQCVWEFPGGKQEENETMDECLTREWLEELNLEIEIKERFYTSIVRSSLCEPVIRCHFFLGEIKNIEYLKINVHKEVKFFSIEEARLLPLFEGDEMVLNALEKYLFKNKDRNI